jgi:integrase
VLLMLEVMTGARVDELLALTWRSVSLHGGYVQIQTSACRFSGKGITIKDVKSGHSQRKIELSETAIAALGRHRAPQIEERLRHAGAWLDLVLVFPTGNGTPIAVSNFHNEYRRFISSEALPYIRPYDLHHSAATPLLLKGVHLKKVSVFLGHSSVAITLSIYSHVLPSMHRDAATAKDELFAPAAAKKA